MDAVNALYYVKVFSAFIFVIAFMYLLGWFMRKYAGRQLGVADSDDSKDKAGKLKIVDSLALDYKRRLIVVDYGGKAHMIILSPQSETVVASNIEIEKFKQEQNSENKS